MFFRFCLASVIGGLVFYVSTAEAGEVDRVLDRENRDRKILQQPVPIVDDLTFMRRLSVDLIGRIPTGVEIGNFLDWPSEDRRGHDDPRGLRRRLCRLLLRIPCGRGDGQSRGLDAIEGL